MRVYVFSVSVYIIYYCLRIIPELEENAKHFLQNAYSCEAPMEKVME